MNASPRFTKAIQPRLEVITLERLSDFVSPEWGPWGTQIEITQSRLDAFAEVTGDRQFIHLDPVAAKAAGYRGTIAHGALLLSLLAVMRSPHFDVGPGIAVKNVEGEYQFLRPVYTGESVHARERMKEVKVERGGNFRVTFEYEIHVVGGKKAASGTLVLFYCNPKPQEIQ
ncbi:MAG: MaoC family dehydratase [Candidatus Kaiserbacteria bacterium]|nr:MaoC family dehydratase [Candidatus Kaiserbacteria bacterium]